MVSIVQTVEADAVTRGRTGNSTLDVDPSRKPFW